MQVLWLAVLLGSGRLALAAGTRRLVVQGVAESLRLWLLIVGAQESARSWSTASRSP